MSEATLTFRAAPRLFVIVGIFMSLFAGLGLAAALRSGDWTLFILVIGSSAVFLALLRVLRLDITPDGIKYRNLSGSREVAFSDLSRAYVEVVRATDAPQGVATFWVERQNGGKVKINLRTFPIEAAAVLFSALEAHGLQIEVPDAWAARRLVEQVRAEQARLRG